MAKKTFKIGEYCQGGVITVETTKSKVAIIGKEWDYSQGTRRGSNQSNAKEFTRIQLNPNDPNARRIANNFLNDLTTSYYSDVVMEWIEKTAKVSFEPEYF